MPEIAGEGAGNAGRDDQPVRLVNKAVLIGYTEIAIPCYFYNSRVVLHPQLMCGGEVRKIPD
jgi:hypothetical protein